jgi:hypothetical protein
VLDLSRIDLEEIATALADQTDYEHCWLIDPQTGEIAFWTSDGVGGLAWDGHRTWLASAKPIWWSMAT